MDRKVRVLVVLAVLSVAAAAHGDRLVTRDGRTFEGKIISRGTSIVFEAHKYGSTVTVTIPRTQVASLTVGEITPAPTRPPARSATRKLGDVPAPPEAPPVKFTSGPTYYVIPLVGEVGMAVAADVLAQSLADAARRKPTVVILHVDSPGGLIDEVAPLAEAIRSHKKALRIVVLVKRAISAAAVTVMVCDDIYVEPAGIIGAATAFQVSRGGKATAVDEKTQSLWRATARSCAAMGGHSPLLADAMIDASIELYVVEREGKKVIVDRRPASGSTTVVRKGKLLAMTADEALACGLAAAKVEDYAALGRLLGKAGWTECEGLARPLADYRAKAVKVLADDMIKLKKQYDADMTSAMQSAPWRGRYEYDRRTRKFTRASWRQWNERSRKCIGYLTRAKDDLAKAAAIAEKFPRVFGDPKWLRVHEEQIKAIRTKIARESQKSSPF